MRDDWEKLSDEKSSLRACRRRIPNRSRVVSHESFTCFTTSAFTFYTYYIKLSTGGHTVSVALQIQYLYIQYSTIQYFDNLEYSNRMLVPELDFSR